MNKFIIALATKMQNSKKYQESKSFFRMLLQNNNYPYKKYFDGVMIGLIVLSITILILDKAGTLPKWMVQFDLYVVSSIFGLEYLLRLWISDDIHKYIVQKSHHNEKISYYFIVKQKILHIFSLSFIIDFIAIFPNFRIIRLLKLYRYMHGASSLFDALLKKRFEFIFLGYLLIGITFSLGSIFYLLEFGINEKIGSYLDAIYWALVTISTVGYGDISPVTELGKMLSMFGIVFGIAMISFMTSVMVSAFSERFDELRNQDTINHVNQMHNVVIINGYGHLAMTVARKLKNHHKYEPVIIEQDEAKVTKAQEDGYKVIRADSSSAKLVKELYYKDNITAMFTLTNSDIENIYFILNAKSVYASAMVYARMNDNSLQAQYKATKVNGVVEPYAMIDSKAFNYLEKHSTQGKKSILFLGYTHKSSHICKKLKEVGIEVTIYELNDEVCDRALEDGFKNVVKLNSQTNEVPQKNDAIVVCAMNEEALNVYYAITLRANGFEGEIVALSDSKEDNRKLILAGVSMIYDMYEESASQFIEMIEKQEEKINMQRTFI